MSYHQTMQDKSAQPPSITPPPTDNAQHKPHLTSLTAIRCVAILLIFFSHLVAYTPFESSIGANGVSIFIFLSGFLIAYAHYRDSPSKNPLKNGILYCRKKLGEFYFLHFLTFIAALILAILPVILVQGITYSWVIDTINKGILNLALLQSWIPDSSFYFSFNAVAWYLSITIFFYLLSPFILRLLTRINTHLKTVIFIAVIVLIQVVWTLIWSGTPYAHAMIYIFPAYRLLEFMLGCLFGKIFLQILERRRADDVSVQKKSTLKFTLLEVLSAGLFTGAVLCWSYIPEAFAYSVFYVPFVSFLVFVFAFGNGFVSKTITNPVMLFVGTISFEIFLIHVLVISYLASFCGHFGIIVPDVLFVCIVIVVTLLLGWMAHLYLPKIQKKMVSFYHKKFC